MECGDPYLELNAAIALLRIDEGQKVEFGGKLTVDTMTSEQRLKRIAELQAQLGLASTIEGEAEAAADAAHNVSHNPGSDSAS